MANLTNRKVRVDPHLEAVWSWLLTGRSIPKRPRKVSKLYLDNMERFFKAPPRKVPYGQ